MWIVLTALRRPYTFIVLAIVIALFGVRAALTTPTDIFPSINIPVIAVVWTYNGLLPNDMSSRVIYYYERTLTSQVGDIEHLESTSLDGYGVVKIFFQKNVDIAAALAQVTAASQTVLKLLPEGITPPYVLSYSASSVPILQLALSSKQVSQMQLFDRGQNFIRPQLATVAGAAVPSPYGGKILEVQIDLDQQAMQAFNISPDDVVAAVSAQNLVLPAGDEKIGKFDWNVALNASPVMLSKINDLPLKKVNGTIIYIHDVAFVHDGSPPQTNLVRVDGARAVLMTILKAGSASTLSVIDGVRSVLPRIRATLPNGVDMHAVGDQSIFVKAAVFGVIREAALAAALVGVMILLFLGSWRSTIIILIEIPLAILFSLTALSWLGETINVMTLGGLALAVGILVDDGTVTIENINYHLEQGKQVEPAILDGAQQIVIPAFVTLLCLCIVFVPMFQLGGIAGYLFTPLAEAVVFALIGSFILSRTLVPTLANYLLRAHQGDDGDAEHGGHAAKARSRNPLTRFQQGFEKVFERVRDRYRSLLSLALGRPKTFIAGFLVCVLLSFGLFPFLGQNFFPSVDAGQILMHVRAQPGTRIEETAREFDLVEQTVRQTIPPEQLDNIVDNIGLPYSGINMAYQNTGTIGPEDGDALISLKEDHAPTAEYVQKLRTILPQKFPGVTFSFLPADIVSQILNFGLPAPIDLQVIGNDEKDNYAYATTLLKRIRAVPGIADPRIQQVVDYPQLNVQVDRTLASEVGLTQRDVANSLLVTLSGSGQVKPNFWLNTKTGVSYPIVAQTPQYRIDTLSDLINMPITSRQAKTTQYLGALANVIPGPSPGVVSHYNVQPTIDIFGALQGRDLGAVSRDIDKIVAETNKDVPRGSYVVLRGQVQTMNSAYSELYVGLAGAIVLIYLVIVVNFQSWLDPFIIITALPGALAGIVWLLFLSGTTLSVPALTGAIMCMGIATANSILLVSFAREGMARGLDAATAALESGFTRFRPVLMTALAMVIGMLPMAFALGEGGEQNAPLGRAVIGGLLVATLGTLLFVPTLFSLLHARDRLPDAPASSPIHRVTEKTSMASSGPEPHDPRPEDPPAAPPPRHLRLWGLLALVAAIGAAAYGIEHRRSDATSVQQWTQQQAVPTVAVITPQKGDINQKLSLPGDIQAWYAAPIYARVSGYLKMWYFDYGAHVKAGDVLAEIDAPDLDAQRSAAEGKLRSAESLVKAREAERQFAETTYQRWRDSPKGVVSEQEEDSKKADYGNAVAQLSAAQDQVQADQGDLARLQALEGFKKILAPFDGVVTARETDIGALIKAGGGSGPELFKVADIHEMRVFVQVPQQQSADIHQGLKAKLHLPQYPNKLFDATVATTSGAINQSSRTLLVELHIDNPDGLLQPGAFTQVEFELPGNPDVVRIPTSALLFRESGTEVAMLGPDDKVDIKPVTLGRNLGTLVEVVGGLKASDRIINSPSDSLATGDQVRVAGGPGPSGPDEELGSK